MFALYLVYSVPTFHGEIARMCTYVHKLLHELDLVRIFQVIVSLEERNVKKFLIVFPA